MTRSVEIPEAAVARAAQKLRDEGGEPGHGIHSWRCEHPDRYGDCDCVEVTARAMLEAAALPYLAPAGAETVHLIADGEAVTSCCGRTPFELPRTDRLTVDPKLAGGHFYGADRAMTDEMECRACGYPYGPPDPDCSHEIGDAPAVPQPANEAGLLAAWLQSPEVVSHFTSWFMKATGTPSPDTEQRYRRTAERALAALAESAPSSLAAVPQPVPGVSTTDTSVVSPVDREALFHLISGFVSVLDQDAEVIEYDGILDEIEAMLPATRPAVDREALYVALLETWNDMAWDAHDWDVPAQIGKMADAVLAVLAGSEAKP